MKQLTIGIGMIMLSCLIFQCICRGPDSLTGTAEYQMRRQIHRVQFR